MFQTIRNNLSVGVITILAVTLLLVGIMLTVTKADLAITKEDLEKSQLSLSMLQTDLDGVTVALKSAETENVRLRLDAMLTANTLTNREQGRNRVETVLQETKAKAKAMMENPNDDADKTWNMANVPTELNWLLEQRAYCANRDHDQDSVCIAAPGVNGVLPYSAVHRSNKSRSL